MEMMERRGRGRPSPSLSHNYKGKKTQYTRIYRNIHVHVQRLTQKYTRIYRHILHTFLRMVVASDMK